jgi:metallo-beta-lactamase class B
MHVSYLQTDEWGLVGCNGMVYKNDEMAFVFDTPTRDEDSELLIDWLENDQKVSVNGVVVNHFHRDCLGGLQAFHDRNIASYANELTLQLAKEDSVVIPQNSMEKKLTLGNEKDLKVVNSFFGEAHTKDNIISWLPKEKVIFGGCMVKSLKSGKGFLGDANVDEWANTIQKVKDTYPEAKYVIPGHGKFGDISLLDYTIEMFTKERAKNKL